LLLVQSLIRKAIWFFDGRLEGLFTYAPIIRSQGTQQPNHTTIKQSLLGV